MSRLFWWLATYERPRSAGDYALMLSLLMLLVLLTVALSWPWLTEDAPSRIAAGFDVVRAAVADWVRRALAALPHPG